MTLSFRVVTVRQIGPDASFRRRHKLLTAVDMTTTNQVGLYESLEFLLTGW